MPKDIQIISVNIGAPKHLAAKAGLTGFFKTPQTGAVAVSREGLVDDAIIDRENHGGVDQAVYVYCQADYDWWRETEGLETHAGSFGENLTITGMDTADAHVGARLISKDVVLEITSHRTPCHKFAARMNDATFPKRFWRSGRTGFYCRVIEEGRVQAGAAMRFQPFAGEIVSIAELIAHDPYDTLNDATRQRFLATPLHYKMRDKLAQDT
jgi:MOSC domain-containing protein YiiM